MNGAIAVGGRVLRIRVGLAERRHSFKPLSKASFGLTSHGLDFNSRRGLECGMTLGGSFACYGAPRPAVRCGTPSARYLSQNPIL